MRGYFKNIFNHKNIRLLVIFIGILFLFSILIIKLYSLQIVQGEFLKNQVIGTTSRGISLDASRGSIYDKFGRPLAINHSSFTINIDPSISIPNINDVILKTINLLEKNNEKIVDEFPISKEKPYTFLFNGSESLERIWKNDMNLDQSLTAESSFKILRNRKEFNIDKNLSDEDSRKILWFAVSFIKSVFQNLFLLL